MKKIYAIMLALLMILSSTAALSVSAESNDSNKGENKGGFLQTLKNIFRSDDNKGKNGIGGVVSDMRRNDDNNKESDGKFMLYGTVTAISGSTLTITDKWNSANVYTVNTANAKVTKNDSQIALSSVVVGDVAVIEGTRTGNTVTATSVRVGVVMDSNKKEKKNESHLVGTITALSGSTITFSVKNSNGTTSTYTANTSSSTKIEKNGTTGSFASLAVGDVIKVEGTMNGSVVTATEIKVGSNTNNDRPFTFEGNGQPIIGGTVTAVSGSTITITNKSNVTYTVNATNAQFSKNAKVATLSDIAVGDSILVQGSVNGSAIVASSINDQGKLQNDSNNNSGFFVKIRSFFANLFGF
jgi:hypothetical protein